MGWKSKGPGERRKLLSVCETNRHNEWVLPGEVLDSVEGKNELFVVAWSDLNGPLALPDWHGEGRRMGLLHRWVTSDLSSREAGLEGCCCAEAVSQGVP